jgi:hypothetical protein
MRYLGQPDYSFITELTGMSLPAAGVVAVDRVSAALDPQEKRRRAADSFSRSRQAQERTKGYRNDPSGRGISRVERMTLKATAANAARVHDRGGHTNPVSASAATARAGRSSNPAKTSTALTDLYASNWLRARHNLAHVGRIASKGC